MCDSNNGSNRKCYDCLPGFLDMGMWNLHFPGKSVYPFEATQSLNFQNPMFVRNLVLVVFSCKVLHVFMESTAGFCLGVWKNFPS